MRQYDLRSLGQPVFSENTRTGSVAVIVPLYNYETVIEDCLVSVFNQSLYNISLIVVDDCSTDNSGQAAVDWARKNAERFATTLVVRHQRNQGLSMARNSGIVWSKEPLLFMLDADNRLRPRALERLSEAIHAARAEFAYSHLWQFGDATGIGQANVWDPRLLRFGNYIDAMALIKRSALETSGGYAVLGDDYGWEDYDLWCQFASLGFSGVFVPEVLCDYRVHGESMTCKTTNLHWDALRTELALRHPRVFRET